MLFVVHCLDAEGAQPKRDANFELHKKHIASAAEWGVRAEVTGPMTTDDGNTIVGSLFVIEAADRVAAERFCDADPFARAGVWIQVSIHAFRKVRG